MLHTQPPIRRERCFHFADEDTEGQKGRMTCSKSYTARGQSRHGAQVSVYHHPPSPPHPRAHSPAIVSLPSSSHCSLLCSQNPALLRTSPKPASTGCPCWSLASYCWHPQGPSFLSQSGPRKHRSLCRRCLQAAGLPQLYVCWSSCLRERGPRPHLVFSVGPPH